MSSAMQEPTFWILTVLAGGRRHGYAIVLEAAELSGGRVTLKIASLYSALERLQREGLIAMDGDDVVNGRTRRYFLLTELGEQRLADEVLRLEQSLRQARTRLGARATSAVPSV